MNANRQAFETMKQHMLTQMRASRINDEPDSMCAYRGRGGLKCAVGALIPDSEYKPEFEDGYHGLPSIIDKCRSLQGIEFQVLKAVQNVHDTDEPADWAEELNALEKRLKFYF
jgi:hypothetical protein